MCLAEAELMNQLDPIQAPKVDFGQEGPTRHPYFAPPELKLTRLYSVSTFDVNYEFWNGEFLVPYSDKSCIIDARQIVRLRHEANVSYSLFRRTYFRELLSLTI